MLFLSHFFRLKDQKIEKSRGKFYYFLDKRRNFYRSIYRSSSFGKNLLEILLRERLVKIIALYHIAA